MFDGRSLRFHAIECSLKPTGASFPILLNHPAGGRHSVKSPNHTKPDIDRLAGESALIRVVSPRGRCDLFTIETVAALRIHIIALSTCSDNIRH